MPIPQRIVQVCLLLVSAVSLFGGGLQLFLGQPDTSPRLDNVHRFMAGIYWSMGFIGIWTALTIRQQSTLVYLLAFAVFMAAVGRAISISKVGVPEPAPYWLGMMAVEFLLPVILVTCQQALRRGAGAP